MSAWRWWVLPRYFRTTTLTPKEVHLGVEENLNVVGAQTPPRPSASPTLNERTGTSVSRALLASRSFVAPSQSTRRKLRSSSLARSSPPRPIISSLATNSLEGLRSAEWIPGWWYPHSSSSRSSEIFMISWHVKKDMFSSKIGETREICILFRRWYQIKACHKNELSPNKDQKTDFGHFGAHACVVPGDVQKRAFAPKL